MAGDQQPTTPTAPLDRRAPTEAGCTYDGGRVTCEDLATADVTDGVLFQVEELEVYFPIHESFFKALISTEKKWVKAVDKVSFQVKQGEILALVGESGCGKTTTGRAMLRLEEPTGGHILYKGLPVELFGQRTLRDYRKKAQIIFQDPYNSINPKQTIYDIVAEPLEVNAITTSEHEKEERVVKAINEAGLRPAQEYLYRYPHELSGGQRQRVCIAGATVLEPDVIVADEPVASLDVSIRNDILKLMVEQKDKLGVTYIFITHDLSLAWVISDRIAVMYLGRIVEIGDTEEVVSNPKHPYTKALISVIPVPDPLTKVEHVILSGETPNPVDIPTGCRFHPRCPEAIPACSEVEPTDVHIDGDHDHYAACIRLT
jgi:oligopeptide/dipeptide ABC transporter ATP-binding protein